MADPLMLTVSGARGIVGSSMTPSVAADYASAFGTVIRRSRPEPHPLVYVGRDSRPSGETLAPSVMDGLASVGCRVFDLGISATPTVSVMIGDHGAAGGIVITASHNPIEWNGIKGLGPDGAALPADQVNRVIALFRERTFAYVDAGEVEPVHSDESANAIHVAKVVAAIDPDLVRARRFKVVLDSVNGAGCAAGRALLEELGCEVVHIGGEPTGRFAHNPEPLEENLRELAERTRSEGAACGFAQDPDADRLAIIDETGRYIGEEYTLVLAARRVLETRGPGPMAANLSTSRMIDDLAEKHPGASVIRTAVGEANVASAMKKHNAVVGGEGNGGVILPPGSGSRRGVAWVRDSLAAMALVLELLASEAKPLSSIVSEMPRYAMIKEKFELAAVAGEEDEDGSKARQAVAAAIAKVVDGFARERVNTVDGVRIDFAGSENGWVHLRPSNTEPIIRIIAEAASVDRARELVRRVHEVAGL